MSNVIKYTAIIYVALCAVNIYLYFKQLVIKTNTILESVISILKSIDEGSKLELEARKNMTPPSAEDIINKVHAAIEETKKNSIVIELETPNGDVAQCSIPKNISLIKDELNITDPINDTKNKLFDMYVQLCRDKDCEPDEIHFQQQWLQISEQLIF